MLMLRGIIMEALNKYPPGLIRASKTGIPAQAGMYCINHPACSRQVDSGFRRNDEEAEIRL